MRKSMLGTPHRSRLLGEPYLVMPVATMKEGIPLIRSQREHKLPRLAASTYNLLHLICAGCLCGCAHAYEAELAGVN